MRGRLARRFSSIAQQIGHAGRVARDAGWKAAITERIGAATARSPQWRDLDERFEHQRFVHHHAQHATEARFDGVHEWLRNSDARHDQLTGQLWPWQGAMVERVADLEHRVADAEHRLPATVADAEHRLAAEVQAREAEVHALQRQIDQLRAGAQSLNHVVTDWLWAANAPLPARPLISVVMTTAYPERAEYLRSAIDSVLVQTYGDWELVVVDDSAVGFLDPVPAWWPADPRVRLVRSAGRSEGRARNVGVDAARGDVLAYLDDDCRWFPWWLHAVARAFGTDPDLGMVHGIRVVEADPGGDTWSYAQAVDDLSVHTGNPVDTNVLAHRVGLPGTEWPDLSSCADYDMVVRLARRGARYLPVPAATYAVTSPSRAWAPERADVNRANFAVVQRRARQARPLRVVAHNGLYPLLSETYIGDELEALRRRDVDVALSRVAPATVHAPSRIDAPIHASLADAIAAHDPDLVLTHWAGVGLEARAECAAAEVPMAIRLHSFDGGLQTRELIDDWCIGVWAYGHRARQHDLHFHLDTLLVDPPPFSDAPRNRSLLSLSAGLPKKDFPTLIGAMAKLASVPFHIVMATTNGYETVPATVRGLIKQHDLAGVVSENLPFADAQAALGSTGVLVYSLGADEHIGQPRSVIEAAIAGTPLVLPTGVEFDDLIGDTAHRYVRGDVASLAAAIDDALDRPRSLDERRALAERVVERHASETVFDSWANSLTTALVTWQRRARTDREGVNLRWWWQT